VVALVYAQEPELQVRARVQLDHQVVVELLVPQHLRVHELDRGLAELLRRLSQHLGVVERRERLPPPLDEVLVALGQVLDELVVEEAGVQEHVVAHDRLLGLEQALHHCREPELLRNTFLDLFLERELLPLVLLEVLRERDLRQDAFLLLRASGSLLASDLDLVVLKAEHDLRQVVLLALAQLARLHAADEVALPEALVLADGGLGDAPSEVHVHALAQVLLGHLPAGKADAYF